MIRWLRTFVHAIGFHGIWDRRCGSGYICDFCGRYRRGFFVALCVISLATPAPAQWGNNLPVLAGHGGAVSFPSVLHNAAQLSSGCTGGGCNQAITSTTAGNLLTVAVLSPIGNLGTVTVSDTQSDTFSLVTNSSTSGGAVVYLYKAENITAGSTNVNVTVTTSGFIALSVIEWSGAATSSATETPVANLGTAASNASVTCSGATGNAGDTMYTGGMGNGSGSPGGTLTSTSGTFTVISTNGGSGNVSDGYLQAASTTTYNSTFQKATANNFAEACFLVGIKP